MGKAGGTLSAVDDLDFADVEELIGWLDEAGVHATMNENDVRVPGVWIRFDELPDPSPLGGAIIRLTLFPVSDKTGDRMAQLGRLAALWNTVRPVVQAAGGPSGPVVPTGLTLPSSPVALPALSVPLDLHTVSEGEAP